ncbi:Creatinase/aminopeptidase [Microthyrium microscopicum]|uniref:Creatinase/aminopeptidase n=1 Tax=Microthyrium microscopicum TaxID=703497 RepID=A0A6A6U1D0_9PEZI|nr:Creatinase/aminopeptidase [Microthyrium microscopicum]
MQFFPVSLIVFVFTITIFEYLKYRSRRIGPEYINKATPEEEAARSAYLLDAQIKASALFDDIERDLIRPGVTEKELSKEVWALAKERHNITKVWHSAIVRSGAHTLLPHKAKTEDRTIQADDILFVDLGPVFAAWEADFGRTFVLGSDPVKLRLRDSLEPVWNTVKARYLAKPSMTGEQLYNIACKEAKKAGWEFGSHLAGHFIGELPHDHIPKNKVVEYIAKGNKQSMERRDKHGRKQHWILEIHLVDRCRQIGGFFEQLLTVES